MGKVSKRDFFAKQEEQSKVKSQIVTHYFASWARVMCGSQPRVDKRIAYIDLFSGPGIYGDGSKSTPISVLESALQEPRIRENLITIFNDESKEAVTRLREAISNINHIEDLSFFPDIRQTIVGNEFVNEFKNKRFPPAILFLDPWGYKGISIELINAVIKDWGCECIFFFNFKRINSALGTKIFDAHLEKIIGSVRINKLKAKIVSLSPTQREEEIMLEVSAALKEEYAKYVLLFRFKDTKGTRTSHFIIFATKAFKGYCLMKKSMATFSSWNEDGVASFEYNSHKNSNTLLGALNKPLEKLAINLCQHFAGRYLKFDELFKEHCVGTPFLEENYREALKKLERLGVLSFQADAHRPKETYGSKTVIIFPEHFPQVLDFDSIIEPSQPSLFSSYTFV